MYIGAGAIFGLGVALGFVIGVATVCITAIIYTNIKNRKEK